MDVDSKIKDYMGKHVTLTILPAPMRRMGIGAGGKIIQNIEEDENDASIWDIAGSKMLNVQIVDSVDFHNMTGLPPPPTPINAQTYANESLPFYDRYREKESKISGAFEGVKGVVEIGTDFGGAASVDSEADAEQVNNTHEMVQYPESSIHVPVVMLDVDDNVPPFKSVHESDDEWD